MKVWKLVSGILSIVLCLFVMMQSCAVGVADALSEEGMTGGGTGVVVAALLLAAGIVSIVTRNSKSKATFILYLIAGVIGLAGAGDYGDLQVWGAWCLICAVIALISLITGKKKEKITEAEKE